MKVVIYTKPSSVQCSATYRHLDAAGIEYETIDLSKDPAALEQVESLGYLQAPVVITPWDHWSGLRGDKIDELAQQLKWEREIIRIKAEIELLNHQLQDAVQKQMEVGKKE